MVPTTQAESRTQRLDTFARNLEMKLNQAIADYIFLLDFYKVIPPEKSGGTPVAQRYWSFGFIAQSAIFILGLMLRIMSLDVMPLQIRKIGTMVECSLAIVCISSGIILIFQPRILQKIIDICRLSFQDALTEIKAQINNLLFAVYLRLSQISPIQNAKNSRCLILETIDAQWRQVFKEDDAVNSSGYLEISERRKDDYCNHPDFSGFTRADIYKHYSSQLLTLEIVLEQEFSNFIRQSMLNPEILNTLEGMVEKIIHDIGNNYHSSELNFSNFQDPISLQHELVATRFFCQDTDGHQYELPSNLTSDLQTVEGLAHFSVFKHMKSNLNCKIANTKINFSQVDLLFNATKETSTIAMANLLEMTEEEIKSCHQKNFNLA